MRPPFVDFKLYTTVSQSEPILDTIPELANAATAVTLTKSRSSTIVGNFVGHLISVYNGKAYKRLLVKETMIGHKLGAFIFTKKLGKSIHNSDRNAKKKEKQRRKITQKKVRKTATAKKTPAPKPKKKK